MEKCLSAIFIFLFSSLAVSALSQEKTDSIRTLDPSFSISFRYGVYGEGIPAEDLKSVTQIADALRLFSGVQIKDYGGVGGLKTVNVRSLGSEHTGIFIDGIQVDNAQNMQVDLGRFSADNLGSISLFNGGRLDRIQSAKEYSMASSVYLESAVPDFKKEKRMNMNLKLQGGSFGTWAPSMKVERRLGGKTSGRFNAAFVHTDGRYRFTEYDTTMIRRNSDLSSFNAEGQLFHKGKSEWDAKTYYYDSERGLPGPVVRRPVDAISSLDRQADRDFFVQGSWKRHIEGSGDWDSEWQAKGKYAFSHTRYVTNPSQDPQAMPVDNRYTQQSAYLSCSRLFRHSGGFSFNLAQDFQYSCLDADLKDFVYPARYSSWTAAAVFYEKDDLLLSASLLDNIAVDRFGNHALDSGFSKTDKTRNFLVPAFRFQLLNLGHLNISGFAKRSCRMPSFNDLYYTLVGNSSLYPETAWQFDLGATRSDILYSCGLASDFIVEAYRNYVTDKIVAVPTVNQFRWSMYNIGKARITGADIRWLLTTYGNQPEGVKAELALKYSFQRAADLSSRSASSWKGQIPYIPRHSGSVSAGLCWKGWKADLSWIVTGKRWSSSANLEEFKIDPWSTIDLWFSKNLGDITLRVSFMNLTNEKYQIVRGYPMPGFNAAGTLEYSF